MAIAKYRLIYFSEPSRTAAPLWSQLCVYVCVFAVEESLELVDRALTARHVAATVSV
jgi:hypothetical protein